MFFKITVLESLFNKVVNPLLHNVEKWPNIQVPLKDLFNKLIILS